MIQVTHRSQFYMSVLRLNAFVHVLAYQIGRNLNAPLAMLFV